MLYSALLYAIWSSMFALGKKAVLISTPVFLTASRMLLAGIVLLIWMFIRKSLPKNIPAKVILSLVLLGFFSVYLTNVLEFWGLQYLSAAKTCFIYSLSPFFAALLSFLHFKEKMNRRKWIGFAIGFAGFLPVLFLQGNDTEGLSSAAIFSLPALAVMAAAFFSVYGWVLLRVMVKDNTLSPASANCFSMLIGGAIALFHSILFEKGGLFPVTAGHALDFFGLMALMTLISNLICYNLYGYLLKRYTATLLSFMGLLSPIFASLHGWLLLGERPSPIILGCTALICLGSWVVYRSELKQGYIKQSAEQPADNTP